MAYYLSQREKNIFNVNIMIIDRKINVSFCKKKKKTSSNYLKTAFINQQPIFSHRLIHFGVLAI